MTAGHTGTVPKRGDRVRMGEKPSLFEVVGVNTLMHTASLKSTDGKGHVTRHVSWSSLRFKERSRKKENPGN
jgi:hypothetical protein